MSSMKAIAIKARQRLSELSFASLRERLTKAAGLLVSPAALCLWAVIACIGFSIGGSNASRTIVFGLESKFGYTKTVFPVQMKRWDEELFNLLSARAKADMAEFLKNAEQDATGRPAEAQTDPESWKPYTQSVSFVEQFRSHDIVSYLEISTAAQGDAEPAVTYRTVNFDKKARREFTLADFLDSPADRSKPLEAMAAYARADIKERTGEEEEESQALLELTRPDLSVYERFTLCPSTKFGKAAGLTIHFPPSLSGPYAGSDFHVTIPYTVFAKYLKPEMKQLFAGEPRQAPISLDDLDS
ncbi:MAG TPA: RsiV family protein [Hyphomicrobiales bacterium]|nr:RsiV family protein [Hyphomicrobiales bacterium]